MVPYEDQGFSPTIVALMAIERKEGKEQGIELGIKIGIERGKMEERRNLALILLRKDFTDNHVAELTTLGLEEVKELRKRL